jgi:PST family polysaccharide transporter
MLPGKKNNLIYNSFSLGIVQGVTSVLQLIVIPYVISRIGVDGFGVVAVAQVVMFYLSAFTEYGFNQTATRDISIFREDRQMISGIFFRVIFSKLILCFLSFLLLLALVVAVPVFRAHTVLYLAGFAFVAGQAMLINWFLQGMEKMQLMAAILLVARLLFVLLVFLFIKSKPDAPLYLIFLGGGNFVMGLLSIFLVIKQFNLEFRMPTRKEIWQEFLYGWPVTVSNLSINVCQYTNIFILRVFTNDLLTGYYSIAERIFLTIRQMLGVFSQSAYPAVCRLVKAGREPVISFFRKSWLPFFIAFTAACILIFVLAPQAIYFFSGHGNQHTVFLLRVFAGVLIIASLSIPATLILLATDRRESYFRVYAAAALLNVLLNFLLAYFFNSTGTVTAILITELFITTALNSQLPRLSLFSQDNLVEKTGV